MYYHVGFKGVAGMCPAGAGGVQPRDIRAREGAAYPSRPASVAAVPRPAGDAAGAGEHCKCETSDDSSDVVLESRRGVTSSPFRVCGPLVQALVQRGEELLTRERALVTGGGKSLDKEHWVEVSADGARSPSIN